MVVRILMVLGLSLIGVGAIGCEEEVADVETPAGEVEVTRD